MDDTHAGKDESSIRPVSSLRSRFEQLGKEVGPHPSSPTAARSPFLPPLLPEANSKLAKPLQEKSWMLAGTPVRDATATAADAASVRGISPVRRRPQSVAGVSPSRKSPPLVTINSPQSPDKKQRASVDWNSPTLLNSRLPRSLTPSPSRPDVRPPSRATTPAIEARTSSLLQSMVPPKAASDGSHTAPSTPDLKPKVSTSSVPPPVNRAGKPQVPLKPTNLSKKAENLSAPETGIDVTDHSISPFSTPPSSGTSSPRPRDSHNLAGRTGSEPVIEEKPRANSDASFVERIRTNSSAASSLQRPRGDSDTAFLARARAGSNASFVEPSSLPDSWSHPSTPPLRQAITHTRSDRPQVQNGTSRPTRHQTIALGKQPNAEDLPQDRPRLPARPELLVRSGRTSPTKPRSGRTSPVKQILRQRSMGEMKRAATIDVATPPHRIPATKPTQRSALTLGFNNQTTSSSTAKASPAAPPAVPAPRRSMDRRPHIPPVTPAPITDTPRQDVEEPLAASFDAPPTATSIASDYPDYSQASRRPPKFSSRPWHIATGYDTKRFAVCGEYVCTTGHRTKAWSLRTGEQLLDLEHHEMIKVSALVFKPAAAIEDEGKRVWLGTSVGEIHELDIPSQSVVKVQTGAHPRREILRMFRYAAELWTLDDAGDLNVWKPDRKGMPSLDSQYQTFRTVRGHTFSIALGHHLWIATGKDVRVFAPSTGASTDFHVLSRPLSQPDTAEIHSGTTLSGQPDLVYFGHADGKVSIYNRRNFSCTAVVRVSLYKITCLAGVGDYLWAGFNTGMAYVYDPTTSPWLVKKDWQAHEMQICGINAERSSVWKMDRLQVVTLGHDNMLRIWDGLLEEDWLDSQMQKQDSEFCSFREISVAVLSWNAGASKPSYLQYHQDDHNFLRDYVTDREPPDIFVFGFQELVDLEDKKLTAKTFFKGKKKDANEQEHMSHQYRAWRDHLSRCLEEYIPTPESYVLLSTTSLVGLFTCVFVKSSLRSRIKHVQHIEVKRGMSGMYGNKGALVLRMVVDDSSLCFVNCHLAAGQTQTLHRNNDVAAILESEALPSYPLDREGVAQHSDVFPSGGDGSMILDHEICILNGDLNYRIDTMGRETVIKHINQNNLWRLLERDQLLLSRKKNPGFRLRAFQESEIRFPPTYKYNLHTDEYDTSEKRRSPAWCDRILYRGLGKVKMEEYRRWEVRVSDHRPVSGRLRLRVKTVDGAKRAKVLAACQSEFEKVRKRVVMAVQVEYLTDVLGLSQKEAMTALKG